MYIFSISLWYPLQEKWKCGVYSLMTMSWDGNVKSVDNISTLSNVTHMNRIYRVGGEKLLERGNHFTYLHDIQWLCEEEGIIGKPYLNLLQLGLILVLIQLTFPSLYHLEGEKGGQKISRILHLHCSWSTWEHLPLYHTNSVLLHVLHK